MNDSENSRTDRRTFMRLLAMGSTGIYLAGCTDAPVKKIEAEKQAVAVTSTPTATAPAAKTTYISNANVTFYTKAEKEYEQLRQSHNKRIDKSPEVIAVCLNTKGVQEALKYAAENNLPVAIKSGGHSLEGFSCNNNGMVINLSRLNTIEWLENNEVKLGPACTLSRLYDQMLPKERLIPGGSCGGVAIGGLALGGGYGIYSRKFGLTCDSLKSVTMVDGTGKIINSDDDAELLWACKGGGAGNFGVITEMRFTTHPAPATLTSHRFRKFNTDAQTAADLMERWFALTADLPETCFSVFILNRKTVYILFTNFAAENEQVKKIIDEFSALTEKASLGSPQKLDAAVKNFYGLQEPSYYKNSSVGLYKNFDDIKGFIVPALEKLSSTPGMLISIGTLGGQISNPEFESASAFPHRARPYLSELQSYWSKPQQQAKMLEAYAQIRDMFQDNGIDTEYINYPDLGFKNWERAYYGENYQRLQEIKKRYDPMNLIRHEQSVRI